MKNKKVFLTALVFLFSFKLFSADFKFNFEPTVGFLYGSIIENVWYADVTVNGNTTTCTPTTRLSMLDWQLHNAPYSGAQLDFEFFEKVIFTFDFITAFNGPFGTMEDYDWKEPTEPDHLTHYSYHTNIVRSYTQINLLLGHTFELGKKDIFSLTPKFGFTIHSFDFDGKGGFNLYEKNGWEPHSFPEEKIVISYSQNFFAPTILLDCQLSLFNFLQTNMDLCATFVKKMEAYDSHLERNDFFKDQLEYVWILQAGLKVFVKIGNNNKIGLKGSVQFIPNAYGFTYTAKNSLENLSKNPDLSGLGGTARLLFSYALAYSFYF